MRVEESGSNPLICSPRPLRSLLPPLTLGVCLILEAHSLFRIPEQPLSLLFHWKEPLAESPLNPGPIF